VTLRIAIVGPGRVGRAFGRRLAAQSQATLLGFVGRTAASAEAAVAYCGAGRALAASDLRSAHVVVFAVPDPVLPMCVATALTADPGRRCALWLHTSGSQGLGVFDAAAARGLRVGSLHPVAPFPDPIAGGMAMQGAPAVLQGAANCRRLLGRLAHLLGLVPIEGRDGDRAAYHAACALAANGLTALRGLVENLFVGSGCLAAADAPQVASALMASALQASRQIGTGAALTGPVRRGDAATVAAHVAALARCSPAALPAYQALMRAALDLAVAQGLDAGAAAAVSKALSAAAPAGPRGDPGA
jgi:predicted short-subunit dehydrogenase-like oxidoreductase (DUF2520 family)